MPGPISCNLMIAISVCLIAGCDGGSTDEPAPRPAPIMTQSEDEAIPNESVERVLQPIPYDDIVLDGRFGDWVDVDIVVDEPSDDAEIGSTIDLGPVRIAHDDAYVSLLIDWGAVVNTQALPDASLELWLDVDGLETTGLERRLAGTPSPDMSLFGMDARIVFTPIRGGYARGGVEVHRPTWGSLATADDDQLSPYDIGLAFAPTYASDTVEIRIERGSQPAGMPQWFQRKEFRGVLFLRAADGTSLDRTQEFSYALASPAHAVARIPNEPMPSPTPGALRVMNWNVERGAFIHSPEPFISTFSAINPDVVLIQELRDTQTAAMVDAWFEAHVSRDDTNPDEWSVITGDGGGDLRCAIASRLPLDSFDPLRMVTFPDRPDRQLRIAAGVIKCDDRNILLISTHLKCCGSAGSREDETRLLEVALLREALDAANFDFTLDGLIIAGDLNLVGSRDPLDNLAAGGDLDGGDLQITELMQLDRLSNATWHDADQPFVPGRLDWLLYSDSTMTMPVGFVFDSRDLSPETRAAHRMGPDATIAASDHFPLVADLIWTSTDTENGDA